MDIQQLIAPIQKILRDAGQLILDAEHTEIRIEQKSAANFVTEVDYAVQHFIHVQLSQLTPDFGVMAEEADQSAAVTDRPVWILDPVDGTTNLMRHYQHSAISLALAEGDELLLGFIYNPFLNEMFIAVRGQGAELNGRRIRVSSIDQLDAGLIGFGTTPYARDNARETFARIETVFMQTLEIRRSGSAALDLAYVACGRLDGFFEMQLQPWDYAAGLLLVHEAGGQTTTWEGRMPSLHQANSMLATNGLIHPALYELIKD